MCSVPLLLVFTVTVLDAISGPHTSMGKMKKRPPVCHRWPDLLRRGRGGVGPQRALARDLVRGAVNLACRPELVATGEED